MRSYLNTLIIAVNGVTISVILTISGAYFFSLENASLKKTLTLLIIFTMFFSGELISFYLTVKNLGLMNNFPALILPTAINTFNMIIMRTDFAWLPKSLEESATIDGANDFIILFRIILPIALLTVAAIILYYGVGPWNSWFNAMIFLKDRELFPIQLILREILIQQTTQGISSGAALSESPQIEKTIKYATVTF